MWQNTWQLKEKRRPSSDRLPRKKQPIKRVRERAHQSVEAMVRTMKEVIEDKARIELSATWRIRHAAFLQTRFSVGRDGKTPFKRRHHKDYTSQLLPFGSAVDAKVRDKETERSKFDSRFVPSTATESDEHIVGTALGVYTARTVRAKYDQEIWNKGLIESMKGKPWAARSEDSQAEVRLPEERHKPVVGWNSNRKILRNFWDELSKTAGCAACASPRGKKQCCVPETRRGVENEDIHTIRTHDAWYRHRNTTGHLGSHVHFHSPHTNDIHQRH